MLERYWLRPNSARRCFRTVRMFDRCNYLIIWFEFTRPIKTHVRKHMFRNLVWGCWDLARAVCPSSSPTQHTQCAPPFGAAAPRPPTPRPSLDPPSSRPPAEPRRASRPAHHPWWPPLSLVLGLGLRVQVPLEPWMTARARASTCQATIYRRVSPVHSTAASLGKVTLGRRPPHSGYGGASQCARGRSKYRGVLQSI